MLPAISKRMDFLPNVGTGSPLAARRSFRFGLIDDRSCEDTGNTLTAAPVSMRKFLPLILS